VHRDLGHDEPATEMALRVAQDLERVLHAGRNLGDARNGDQDLAQSEMRCDSLIFGAKPRRWAPGDSPRITRASSAVKAMCASAASPPC